MRPLTDKAFRWTMGVLVLLVVLAAVALAYVLGHKINSIPATAKATAKVTARQTAQQVADHQTVAHLNSNAKGSCRRSNERTAAENSSSDGAYSALAGASRLIVELAAIERNPAVARLETAAATNILNDAERIKYLPPVNCKLSIAKGTNYKYPAPVSYRAYLAQLHATGR